MVLTNGEIQSKKRFTFTWDNETKDIYTEHMARKVRPTIDSKRVPVGDYDTLPFGHEQL